MKGIRGILFAVVTAIILSITVHAAETDEIYEKSGAVDLESMVPGETRELLDSAQITTDGFQPDSIEKMLNSALNDLKSNINVPVRSILVLLVSVLIIAAAKEICTDKLQSLFELLEAAAAAMVFLPRMIVLLERTSTIITAVNTFMLAAIPIYTGILVLSGNSMAGSVYGALTITAANLLTAISQQVIMPLTRVFLAVTSVSSLVDTRLTRFTEDISKAVKWALTACVTVFTGILSMQTVLSSQTDLAKSKALKMIASSTIPIVGSAFGDAISVITSGVSTVKAGVGAFGILTAIAIQLPLWLEMLVWIAVSRAISVMADLFAARSMGVFASGCESALKILLALLFSSGCVAIISAALLLCVRGSYE